MENGFFVYLAVGSGVFGGLSLTRFALNLGFLDRPIVIGLLWALCTANWQGPVFIGIFFELLWLDTFPAGTYIPPQQTFAAFFTILTSHYLGLSGIGELLPLVILALPLTRVMHQLESWSRQLENASYQRSWERVQAGGGPFKPGVFVRTSLLKNMALNALAFGLFFGATAAGFEFLLRWWPDTLSGLAWGHLMLGGLAAGLLALRSRRVYEVLLLGGGGLILVLVLFMH